MDVSFDSLPNMVGELRKELGEIKSLLFNQSQEPKEPTPDPLHDLIPKSEVRGKFASSSSLWKWEKEGKIQSYGIGGKRFYKRSELMEALKKVNKKGAKNG